MNNRLLYENLDTSFVNLAALIKHLRQQQNFEGKIRVALSAYEAEVILNADEQMRVLERDLTAGRISEGEDALQRLLIRAREAGGKICVYQTVEEPAPVVLKSEPNAGKSNIARIESSDETLLELPPENENAPNTKIKTFIFEKTFTKSGAKTPDFPFELTNNVEAQAKPLTLNESDWQTLLNLSAELLRTVEMSLAEANLDFAAMFDKARRELAADYPFLNPSIDDFKYQNGKIILREQVNFKMFAASVGELIWRMLEKLARNPKLSNLHRITGEKIRALAAHRKDFYDQFFLTAPLEKFVQTK